MEALQSSPDITDHPETTLKPKHGFSPGKVVCVHCRWSRTILRVLR